MLPAFFDSVLQLIIRTSTDLPPDVRAAMKAARGAEPAGTRSAQALTIITQNIDLAVDSEGAIWRDTLGEPCAIQNLEFRMRNSDTNSKFQLHHS
jgi:tartrate dehydratase alpha subunit/fumarate hydratase class I-like protein